MKKISMQTLSKALDILSTTARVGPDLFKALAILGNQKNYPGNQIFHYLKVFQRLYQPQKEEQ